MLKFVNIVTALAMVAFVIPAQAEEVDVDRFSAFFGGTAFAEESDDFEDCVVSYVIYDLMLYEPLEEEEYAKIASAMPNITGGSPAVVRLMHTRGEFVLWAMEVAPEQSAWIANCHETLYSLDEME